MVAARHAVADRRLLVDELARRVASDREARWIVEHAESASSGNDPAPLARSLAERRANGEPLQYVLGIWPFREIELAVDRRVLIPRPETEQLAGVALAELRRSTRPSPEPTRCVDLGTGSGAIALSLAVEAPPGSHLEVWATDRSADALEVAAANLAGLAALHPALGSVRLAHGSWFDALPEGLAGSFDLVVSNPPYVSDAEFASLDPSVRDWEPAEALRAASARGVPGFAALEAIISAAGQWLAASGSLVLELAPRQADAAQSLAERAGLPDAFVAPDLTGRSRMLVARRG